MIAIAPHPLFEREGRDLHCQVPISMVQAALGAEIEVPTLEGKVKLRIPEGTQSGKVMRLRGKGLPSAALGARGDQLRAHLRRGADAGSPTRSASCSSASPQESDTEVSPATRASSTSCASCSIERPAPRALRRARARWLACAGGLGSVSPRGEEQRECSAAMRLARADPKRGAAALAAFVREHPQSALADDAALRLAELRARERRRRHRCDAARVGGRQPRRTAIRPTARGSRSRARARARRALARARHCSPRSASPQLAPPERREAQRLLADLAAEADDPADQLRWLGGPRERARPGCRARLDAEIDARAAALPAETLDASRARSAGARPRRTCGSRQPSARSRPATAPAPSARSRRPAALPLAPGGRGAAGPAARHASRRSPAPALRCSRARGRRRALRATPFVSTAARDVTLGVVLPLSGPLAGFGEEALDGVLLAAGVFDGADGAGRAGPRVAGARHAAASRERAAAAVRELAADPDVVAIVGPLLPEEAEAAAGAARRRGVPLLALSRRERSAAAGPLVFRAGTSPRLEAELLAEYAVAQRSGCAASRSSIPDDAYGARCARSFWDAVEARGGAWSAVARYPVGATDFAAPIRSLVGYALLPPGALGALAEREKLLKRAKRLPNEEAEELRAEARTLTGPDGEPLPPFVDFDALFIPDAHQTAGLIAPQLAFHEVQGVRLLGPATWNDPGSCGSAAPRRGRGVPRRVHPGGVGAERRDLRERFESQLRAPPSSLAAQAYDAANLALAAAAGGATSATSCCPRSPRRAAPGRRLRRAAARRGRQAWRAAVPARRLGGQRGVHRRGGRRGARSVVLPPPARWDPCAATG